MSGITNPHPSPNEEYTEYPLPIIVTGDRQSLEREATADAHQYDVGLESIQPGPEPERESRIRPSHRVRFRSLSLRRNEHPEDPSERPLLPPADVDVPYPGTITPPAPAHSRQGSGLSNSRTPDEFGESEKQDFAAPMDRSTSARERFRAAGHLLHEKTVRLTERLGRPPDHGEALNASYIPDDFDSGIPLEELQARRAKHDADRVRALENGEDLIEPPASAEAHRLVRQMTMVQDQLRKRKPQSAYQRSGQTTPEGFIKGFAQRRRSSGLSGGSGILSQLLKLQATQTGSSSRAESVITDDSDSETQVSSCLLYTSDAADEMD